MLNSKLTFHLFIEISKCLPNPCKNGATCLETGESYQCECPEHYNGAHCEGEIEL